MPELYLFPEDRELFAELIKDLEGLPKGVRQGTLFRARNVNDFDVIAMDDLRAFAREVPELIDALGLPSRKAA